MTDNERERRKKENLCYGCGKPGHRARECDSRPQGLHMMNDNCATAGISAKKADTDMKTQMVGKNQGSETQGDSKNKDLGTTAQKEPRKVQGQKDRPKSLANRLKDQDHATISWTACYNNQCLIHLSEKEGACWYPQKKKRRQWKGPPVRKDSDEEWTPESQGGPAADSDNSTEWILMLDDGENATQEDCEWDEESVNEAEDGEQDQCESVFTAPANGRLPVITNRWEYAWCNKNDCSYESQHTHPVYNPDAPPREYVRRLWLHLCDTKECGAKTGLHTHRWDNQEVIELRIPKVKQDDIWDAYVASINARESRQHLFNMNDNNLGEEGDGEVINIELTIDERYSDEYPSTTFECTDVDCSCYFQDHSHKYNIDPCRPRLAILAEQFEIWAESGGECISPDCEWTLTRHLHLPKN